MRINAILLFALSFLLLLPEAFAQRYVKAKRYTSIGGSLNAINYFGDITPSSSFTSADLKFTRPNLSVHIMRRYGPRFSARAAFSWGRLKGDDFKSANLSDNNARFRYARNAHFRNDIKELSIVGMVDLFENRNTYLRRPDFVPYVFAGIAGFHHNPKAVAPEFDKVGNPLAEAGKWVALQPLKTEGVPYSRFQLAIPAGVGFRYKVSPKVDVAFEVGFRYTFFDYLDDVSRNYPTPPKNQDGNFALGGLAYAMTDRTQEPIAANAKEERDFIRMATFAHAIDIDGDGTFDTFSGYGSEDKEGTIGGKRGNRTEKDWYLVTGFHINYILMGGVRCPKFR